MGLTRAHKLAGIFKLAALAESQAAGVTPTNEALEAESIARMIEEQRTGTSPRESAKEPLSTVVPTRVPKL